mmetsp:Transcript_24062/g.21883  ORF Transcript_24062/g.21883 Transcript_24062/m.21883 type:complete len:81 (+) Transcript_24062:1-243(+)
MKETTITNDKVIDTINKKLDESKNPKVLLDELHISIQHRLRLKHITSPYTPKSSDLVIDHNFQYDNIDIMTDDFDYQLNV